MSESYPMQGKVVLITGATTGIGEAAATRLYALGAHVILHGRNPRRVAAAIERMQKAVSDRRTGRLDILTADFEVMDQVYEMVEAFQKRYQRLDVLINNAGAFFLKRQETPGGIEKTFAVNYLAHFLLTTRLLEVLKASAPARVILVSSDAHFQAKLDLNDLMLQKKYNPFTAYANSKLCQVLFTYELARRIRRTPNLALTVNAVHPGFVATQIAKNNGMLVSLGLELYYRLPFRRPRVRTPAEGADTIVYLASDPAAAEFNGKYFYDRQVKATSVPSYDHDLASTLWALSETLVQKHVSALAPPPEPSAQPEPLAQAAAGGQTRLAGASLAEGNPSDPLNDPGGLENPALEPPPQ